MVYVWRPARSSAFLLDVRLTAGSQPRRLFLVFARAQSEQVTRAWGAWNKLQAICTRRDQDGG